MLLSLVSQCNLLMAQLNDDNATISKPCNCEAALRYDIAESSNDFYSWLEFGKAYKEMMTSSNVKSTNINVVFNNLPIGVFHSKGKNSARLYEENVNFAQVIDETDRRKSTTTSSISYTTYLRCLEICRYGEQGPKVYPVLEDCKNVAFKVTYSGAAPKIKIKATYIGKTKHVIIKRGDSKLLVIPRPSNDGFEVLFSTDYSGYEIPRQQINPYQPAKQFYTVSYGTSSFIRKDSTLKVTTDNNHNSRCKTATNPNNYRELTAGVHKFDKCQRGGKNHNATSVYFVLKAEEGTEIVNPQVTVVKGGNYKKDYINHWNQKGGINGFLKLDSANVVYNQWFWGPPMIVEMTATFVERNINFHSYRYFSDGKVLSFYLPNDVVDAKIEYSIDGGKRFCSVAKGDNLLLKLPEERLQNVTLYRFMISKSEPLSLH